MKIDVLDMNGEKQTEADISEDIFRAPIKTHLIHEIVRYQLAKRRSGTASTKNRANVRGGGIKPWRQKGTGRARAGTNRSPLWVGGGIVFGPSPRDFSIKVNKKAKKGALKSALSLKVQNQELMLLDDIDVEEGKTRLAVNAFNALGIDKTTKVLIVVAGKHENLKQATRNITNVNVMDVDGLNVYDILWHQKLIITKDTLEKIEEFFAS